MQRIIYYDWWSLFQVYKIGSVFENLKKKKHDHVNWSRKSFQQLFSWLRKKKYQKREIEENFLNLIKNIY